MNRITVRAIFVMFLIFAARQIPVRAQSTFSDFYRAGMEAFERQEFPIYLDMIRKADSLRPNHPVILYNLAAGYALNMQPGKAFDVLGKRLNFYASLDFAKDEKFLTLHPLPRFKQLLRQSENKINPLRSSETAFSIKHKNLHPEDIIFNPADSSFLISDIRTGNIFAYSMDGTGESTAVDLSSLGYWSAVSMMFDPDNPSLLWITTAAPPQYQHFDQSLKDKSAVLVYDLEKKQLEKSYEIEGAHFFGDILFDRDGTAYISDSRQPVIYRVKRGTSNLRPFLEYPSWWNLQGLAYAADNNILFVADYITGIYRMDLTREQVVPTPLLKDNSVTRGSDGIYYRNHTLLMIQNGTLPKRVGKINLSKNMEGLPETITYPDNSLKALNEPTQGTYVDGIFYYIANSPWAYYDEQGNPDMDAWPEIEIWKLEINY